MSLLIVVSSEASAAALVGLAGACMRAGEVYRCFFTGGGVRQLRLPAVVSALAGADRAVACELSWERHCPDVRLPVEMGSQTDHSAMAGEARLVVSL